MVSASEYAVLASAAYARNDDTLALRKIEEESNGRFKSDDYEVLEGDEDYKVFKKLSTGEVIVACRGTSGLDDAHPDMFIAAGILPFHERSKKIVNVTRKYRHLYDHVTITGHSLGGALASAAAVRTDTMAVTFNQGSSPIDKPIQGLGKVLGYRYKNVVHFAVCNDVVSTSACLVDNVTNIRVPTASSSVLSALRNHRLGQFLALEDEKYKDILTTTTNRVREHQQAHPAQIDGPSNPITKTVGSAGATYASYKAFMAGIDKAIDQLRLYNDPTLHSYLDRLQNAVDNVRSIEENAQLRGQQLRSDIQQSMFESLQNRLYDVTTRVRNLFQSGNENFEDVMIELDGVFDAVYEQHVRDFPEGVVDIEAEQELNAAEEEAIDAFIRSIHAEDAERGPVREIQDVLGEVEEDELFEMEAGAQLEEVGEFLSGMGEASTVLTSGGPLLAGVGAIAGIAVGIFQQYKYQQIRDDLRNQISRNRQRYAHEFHSLLNHLSAVVRRPAPASIGPTKTQKMDLPKIGPTRIEVPHGIPSDISMPADTGRWQDSELDYYGPEALTYLQWRVANPDISGPTKDVVEGIGAAYRSWISPGPFWPERTDGGELESLISSQVWRRGGEQSSRAGVAGYVDNYQWLTRDNLKKNGDKYRRRIEELMSKHVRHKFSELSDDEKNEFIKSGEQQLYFNLDSDKQIELAQLIRDAKMIVETTTSITRNSPNASSFITAAKSLRDAIAKEMAVDLHVEGLRKHARGFMRRNIPLFINGITVLAGDPLMFDAYRLNGADMNKYQVYVSAGMAYGRGQWHRSLGGMSQKQQQMKLWLRDDSYSLDNYIRTGHSHLGDRETQAEFVDRYLSWVEATASGWDAKTHRAVVKPYIYADLYHPTTTDKDKEPADVPDPVQAVAKDTLPVIYHPPVDSTNDPIAKSGLPSDEPQVCVRKRRRKPGV